VGRPRKDIPDAELEVLKLLWDLGPSTIRQLTDRLYPSGGPSHYATVQKLLERLEAKDCVRHRANRVRVNVYRASVDRLAVIAHRLQATADRLCEGSLTPLLTQLVTAAGLSREDREELRRLMEELDRESTPR
jgi:predicted transcriptional regulator